jgi:nitrogen fixation protein
VDYTKEVRKMKTEKKPVNEKVNVGITIPKKELEEMRSFARVDLNGPAVLSLARKGLEVQKRQEKNS